MGLPRPNPNEYTTGVKRAVRIFAEYGDFIHSVIRSRVKNRAQADDLLQDFFISLVSKPPPEGLQNMKGYLFKAIANDLIDAHRRADQYHARLHRYAEHLRYSATEDNPESALLRAEQMNKILGIVETRLQRRESQAIILRFWNRYKIKEIATEIDTNNRAARKCISEGLRKIRRFLKIG